MKIFYMSTFLAKFITNNSLLQKIYTRCVVCNINGKIGHEAVRNLCFNLKDDFLRKQVWYENFVNDSCRIFYVKKFLLFAKFSGLMRQSGAFILYLDFERDFLKKQERHEHFVHEHFSSKFYNKQFDLTENVHQMSSLQDNRNSRTCCNYETVWNLSPSCLKFKDNFLRKQARCENFVNEYFCCKFYSKLFLLHICKFFVKR